MRSNDIPETLFSPPCPPHIAPFFTIYTLLLYGILTGTFCTPLGLNPSQRYARPRPFELILFIPSGFLIHYRQALIYINDNRLNSCDISGLEVRRLLNFIIDIHLPHQSHTLYDLDNFSRTAAADKFNNKDTWIEQASIKSSIPSLKEA